MHICIDIVAWCPSWYAFWNSGHDGHHATIHPHTPYRPRRWIHQPCDGSSSRRISNKPRRLCQDEHYFVGTAETAVNNLRHSARAMMLHGNVTKRFWHFAIAHAAYIHNVTSPSCLDKSKTIFELLFSKRADLTQVPPYGCFATVYKNRRTLQDQSLDLPSDQGVFISIAKHNGIIGYWVNDGSRIIRTRQNLAFDPHLYLFLQKQLSAPAWQTIHNLTRASAQGSTQRATPSTKQPAAQEYASSESDIDDPPTCTDIQEVNNTITKEEADKQDSPKSDLDSDENSNESTRISSRQKRPPAVFNTRHENPIATRKANLLKHYNSDNECSDAVKSELQSVCKEKIDIYWV